MHDTVLNESLVYDGPIIDDDYRLRSHEDGNGLPILLSKVSIYCLELGNGTLEPQVAAKYGIAGGLAEACSS